jgi:tetratricopeptide (TPR) repeat protein
MGEVFRATDRENGQTVAIKLLRQGAGRDEAARFRREIAVLADLRHPNVVQYVDHGTWNDGRPYLAMEWLEGEDLQARTRTQPLGMHDAVEVVRRAAAALAAVHARGVVHRDLKLSNIWLLRGRGLKVKLIDFGVVKLPDPDGFVTQVGAIIGTPHYMAPEQARGDAVTPRADVYALGSVLFRLVTGRLVFPTEHIVALLGQLVLEDPPLASTVRFDVPAALDRLIASCISRNLDERFPDAGELARALARVGPVPNDPPGKESSSSAVRRVPEGVPPSPPSDHPVAPGASERRVVATVLAHVGPSGLGAELERDVRALLGDGDQLQLVQGGRLVIAFGVRRARGDELLRAARASLAIATRCDGARVAISSGQATRRTRGISADALERAATQLDLAAVGGVRVDAATVPMLGGRFALREDASGGVLLHEDPAASSTRRLLGKPTPTVGREKEVSLLDAIFQEGVDERAPRGAIVVGPPGIGKSRIRYELLLRLRKHPTPPEVLVCRGDPMTARGGLGCVARALRAKLGVQDGEPAAQQEAKVRHYVDARSPFGLDPAIAPFVGELVGVRFSDASDEPLRAARHSPGLMQSRMRAAIEALVRADTHRAPQVLVLEDMHWADEPSIDLVDWLLGTADLRFVVLGFARSELHDRSVPWSGRSVTRLEVAPLSPGASEKLVLAAVPELAPEQRRVIAERSGGNALFLEELIRHAAEGKDDVPLTVQALIQARLDTLAPDLRLVARAASVFGRACWSDGVEALVGHDVSRELEALVEAEILTPADTTRILGQREYTFHHGLLRDAIHASLLDEDAASFHGRAATWLEAAGEEDFATLARHAERGGDARKANALFARATEQALANGHMDAVVALADRGLEGSPDDQGRARLLVAKAKVGSWHGRYEDVFSWAGQASNLARRGSAEWAEATRLLSWALRDRGRQGESEAVLAGALSDDLAGAYEPATLALLLAEQARTLSDLGRAAEGRRAAERALKVADGAGAQRERARLAAVDAWFFAVASEGDLGAMTAACRQVISMADGAGDLPLGTRGRCNLGHSLNQVGLFPTAREVLIRAVNDARSQRVRPLEGFALHNLGMSLARLGDYDSALESQRAARRLAEEMGHGRLHGGTLEYEAVTLAAKGDTTAALAMAREALRVSEGQPAQRITAMRVVAWVQMQRHAWHAALESATEASSSVASIDAEEWEELGRLARIEALFALGDDDEGNAALAEAHARVCARAATLAIPEERRGYLSNLAENARILALASERLGLETPRV